MRGEWNASSNWITTRNVSIVHVCPRLTGSWCLKGVGDKNGVGGKVSEGA
jgi:hypothetical protein